MLRHQRVFLARVWVEVSFVFKGLKFGFGVFGKDKI